LQPRTRKIQKNSKSQIIRKLLEQEGDKLTLLWVLSPVLIPGNEETNNVANESLDENLVITEKDPPQKFVKWITQQHEEQQQRKWEQTNITNKVWNLTYIILILIYSDLRGKTCSKIKFFFIFDKQKDSEKKIQTKIEKKNIKFQVFVKIIGNFDPL
jgi:hypothetical protein